MCGGRGARVQGQQLGEGSAVWQLRTFVSFVFGGECAPINVLLARYFNRILDGDDVCMDVVVEASARGRTGACT